MHICPAAGSQHVVVQFALIQIYYIVVMRKASCIGRVGEFCWEKMYSAYVVQMEMFLMAINIVEIPGSEYMAANQRVAEQKLVRKFVQC